MKLLLVIMLAASAAHASRKPDREPLWFSACDVLLMEDNPYKKLSVDNLLAISTISDYGAWLELIVRTRDPSVSEEDKTKIRNKLGEILNKKRGANVSPMR